MSLPTAQPELSLLIPAHNAAPWLAQTLDSIAAQIPQGKPAAHLELLLLDDGSTDTTSMIVTDFAQHRPNLRLRHLHHPTAQGVSMARNRLLDEAQGQWLWFIDADDRLRAGALARLLSIVREAPELDLVLMDHAILRENPGLKHRLRGEAHRPTALGGEGLIDGSPALLLRTLPRAQWHPWGRMVRRAAWPRDLRFPQGRVFEDLAVIPRLMSHCRRSWYCAQPLIDYRSSPTSILGSLDANRLEHWHLALMDLASAGSSETFQSLQPEAVQQAWWDHLAQQAIRLQRVAHRRATPAQRIQAWQAETAARAPRALAAMRRWWRQPGRWPLAWHAAHQRWAGCGRASRAWAP